MKLPRFRSQSRNRVPGPSAGVAQALLALGHPASLEVGVVLKLVSWAALTGVGAQAAGPEPSQEPRARAPAVPRSHLGPSAVGQEVGADPAGAPQIPRDAVYSPAFPGVAHPLVWSLQILSPLLFLLSMTTGCIHVYQPMSGFQGPVVVDPQAPNFQDVSLTVVCHRGDLLTAAEARSLCQHVGTLFENQGALVSTWTAADQAGALDVGGPEPEQDDGPPAADLTLELNSRELHVANDPVSWVLFVMSSTVVPAITESSFAIDVTVRDQSGFLLVEDSLQGRLVRRLGVGAWGTNKLLDRFIRAPEDQITGDQAHEDLSEDLYGQLGQLVFNAKLQWEVLAQVPTTSAVSQSPR